MTTPPPPPPPPPHPFFSPPRCPFLNEGVSPGGSGRVLSPSTGFPRVEAESAAYTTFPTLSLLMKGGCCNKRRETRGAGVGVGQSGKTYTSDVCRFTGELLILREWLRKSCRCFCGKVGREKNSTFNKFPRRWGGGEVEGVEIRVV